MKTIKSLIVTLGLMIGLASFANAAPIIPPNFNVPWGTSSAIASAAPTCTSFATQPVCILNMTANISALTLSGDSGAALNHSATLIFMQDGTGSRTLTVASTILSGTLPAITTAANSYSVWVVQGTAAPYTVVASYDNLPLPGFATTQTSNGTAVAPGAAQAQPTVIVPGMTASNTCTCQAQTLPATWTSGITLACLPQTNAIQCEEINASGGTITPTPITLSIRGLS
jgi:hypothetical protein